MPLQCNADLLEPRTSLLLDREMRRSNDRAPELPQQFDESFCIARSPDLGGLSRIYSLKIAGSFTPDTGHSSIVASSLSGHNRSTMLIGRKGNLEDA